MKQSQLEKFQSIQDFPELVKYLSDELDWPIDTDDFEDMTFEWSTAEFGLDERVVPQSVEIRQLKPLDNDQPWGIFFIRFESSKLPVVALRRILGKLAQKKRAHGNSGDRTSWHESDLLMISQTAHGGTQSISFAHFATNPEKADLPFLKVLGWDDDDTELKIDYVIEKLRENLKWPDDPTDSDAWRRQWRKAFTLKNREVIQSSKELAIRLAQLALAIRTKLRELLTYESEEGPVHKLMSVFKENLISDLDKNSFSDMYAQTIAYGLLSARIINPKENTANAAQAQLPITNPFLRELMDTFLRVGGRSHSGSVGLDFDELGINGVVELLDRTKMEVVLLDFGDRNQKEDPVTHFFEGFLQKYDNEMRKKRGVFYTPQPVVSFIVRSVDEQLRREFGLEDGLADTTTWGELAKRKPALKIPEGTSFNQAFVQILDPATGTGTFLVEVINLIHKTMVKKWKSQGNREDQIKELWNKYVPEHLLPRLYGYELMMAPYTIAHVKIGRKLYETGYNFKSDQRAQVYLTNALEPAGDFSGTLAFAIPALAREVKSVNAIKHNQKFTVVIGNPPYSGVSSNNGEWIRSQLRSSYHNTMLSYFEFNGQPLSESNTRWLNDDYVKFFRLSQSIISSSQVGVQGMITNSSYLDNPTFRGMRESLSKLFPKIYLVNLHGNVKKREKDLDEARDENVFDIQQGVAISLMIAVPSGDTLKYYDLFGPRPNKYQALNHTGFDEFEWNSLTPDSKLMLWRNFDNTNFEEYQQYCPIGRVISLRGENGRGDCWAKGLATTKDHLFISFEQKDLIDKIGLLASLEVPEKEIKEKLGLENTPYFKISDVRKKINSGDWRQRICKVLYRPFDIRYIYWHPELYDVGRGASSKNVMRHMFKENIALITSRMTKGENFAHAFVTNLPVEVISLSSKSSNNAFVFPSVYYPKIENQDTILNDQSPVVPNVSTAFLTGLRNLICGYDEEKLITSKLIPVSVLNYVYAILYSNDYRKRFASFLTVDFPRIPLPGTTSLFGSLEALGKKLVATHLMIPGVVKNEIETIGSRPFRIEKITYSEGTIWIDKAQSLGIRHVSQNIWHFHIGGYQVCEKWLKERGPKKGKPGRTLTDDDIAHYQNIIFSVSETIRIMTEIDGVIDAHGGWPNAFITANS